MKKKIDFLRVANVHGIVVHLFNQHVCDGDWSIERLADWIHSIEPAAETFEATEPVGSHSTVVAA